MRLKDSYTAARCCNPQPGDPIVGYSSHEGGIKVHREDCASLAGADQARLVRLEWKDILAPEEFRPGNDYKKLDRIDFAILKHHEKYGYDYTLKVARILHIEKQAAFDSHEKLRHLDLLARVEPRIIRYRKNIVKGKWIKHRNHTYYDLTEKGKKYLEFYLEHSK